MTARIKSVTRHRSKAAAKKKAGVKVRRQSRKPAAGKKSRRRRGIVSGRLVISLFLIVALAVWAVTITASAALAVRELSGANWGRLAGSGTIIGENLALAAGFAPEAADRVIYGGREVSGALWRELETSLAVRLTPPLSKERFVWRSWTRRFFAVGPETPPPVSIAASPSIIPAAGPSSWVRSMEQGMSSEY